MANELIKGYKKTKEENLELLSMAEQVHSNKWEISVMELKNNGAKFKVTRRIPGMSIAETKLFDTKAEARKQFEEWLE